MSARVLPFQARSALPPRGDISVEQYPSLDGSCTLVVLDGMGNVLFEARVPVERVTKAFIAQLTALGKTGVTETP